MVERNVWRKKGHKAFVVVPAYNEAETIAETVRKLNIVKKSGVIQGFVVVSDGSKDKTAQIARKAGAEVIEYRYNFGKARAFVTGAKRAKANGATIVVTLDAELRNITIGRVRQLIKPIVTTKNLDMVIGTVGTVSKRETQNYSGQRAVRLSAIGSLVQGKGTTLGRTMMRTRYGLERALNHITTYPKIVGTRFRVTRGPSRNLAGMKDISQYLNLREKRADQLRTWRKLNKYIKGTAHRRKVRKELRKARKSEKAKRANMLQTIKKNNLLGKKLPR
ncbi:MAG: glycosyltransferase family 2 protein [archaeon]|jgi:glycosyltransferase involved in cell wall biosynthesis|nr:glycosyltransferase family 2 protein [archaeon]